MVLNESELSYRAAYDTLPLRDAFAVLFFVSVVMLFDQIILINEPLSVLATLVIIVFGKSAAVFLLVRLFGHSNRTALTISTILALIGKFVFILAGLGITLGMMSEHGRNLGCWPVLFCRLCSTRCCSLCWRTIWPKPRS